MKIDIISKPPPLPFGKGDDQFSLLLERYTGEQRMQVLDACMEGGSLQALQFACQRVVADWQNVQDEADNNISMIQEDEKGKRNVFGEFMGSLKPITRQLEVLAGIAAFMGIPKEAIQIPQILEVFEKLEKAGKPNPTGGSASKTPTSASAG